MKYTHARASTIIMIALTLTGPCCAGNSQPALTPVLKAMQATADVVLALDALVPFARWVTPEAEAPAEMNFFFPDFGALCMAENCSHTMHNLVPIRGALVQMGPHKINRDNWDWAEVDRNPFFCPDAKAAAEWEIYLDQVRKAGSSCGAVIELVAENVPAGWGAPIYGKLDAELAAAMVGINAVKGVEIGDGFEVAGRRGSAAHDAIPWDAEANDYRRLGSLAGGTEGGITTGELLVVRAAMKPLATLNRPTLKTVDVVTKEQTVSFKERTDVTAVPALGVVSETMVALVLAAEAQRKFGGDSLDEFVRNAKSFESGLH